MDISTHNLLMHAVSVHLQENRHSMHDTVKGLALLAGMTYHEAIQYYHKNKKGN